MSEQFIYCHECGTKNSISDNFCTNCGTRLLTHQQVVTVNYTQAFKNIDKKTILNVLTGSVISVLIGIIISFLTRTWVISVVVKELQKENDFRQFGMMLTNLIKDISPSPFELYGLLHTASLSFKGDFSGKLFGPVGLSGMTSGNFSFPLVLGPIIPILAIAVGWIVAQKFFKVDSPLHRTVFYALGYTLLMTILALLFNIPDSGRLSVPFENGLSVPVEYKISTGLGIFSILLKSFILSLFTATVMHYLNKHGKSFIYAIGLDLQKRFSFAGTGIMCGIYAYVFALFLIVIALSVFSLTYDLKPIVNEDDIYSAFPKELRMGYWLGLLPYLALQSLPFLFGGKITWVLNSMEDNHKPEIVNGSADLFNGVDVSDGTFLLLSNICYLLVLIPVIALLLSGYYAYRINQGDFVLRNKILLIKSVATAGCYTLLTNGLALWFGFKCNFSASIPGEGSISFSLAINNLFWQGVLMVFLFSTICCTVGALLRLLVEHVRSTKVFPQVGLPFNKQQGGGLGV
ncbi:MAG: zinc ribbon domain-containing protein [Firmicutes bacterium]|nr:zinc ribbon domain-containing protein [Bacillota bacterium]